MKKTSQAKEFSTFDVYTRLGSALDDVLKAAPKMFSEENRFHGNEVHGHPKQKVA